MQQRNNTGGRLVAWLAGALLCLLLAACSSSTAVATTAPLSGTLKVDGSTALQPLAAAAAQQFMQQHAGVTVDVATQDTTSSAYDANRLGSKNGLTNVNDGKADIGASDIYADSSLSHYADLNDHIVCVIPFVLIANPAVGITNLKLSDINGIYATSTITNWSQLGGPNLTIKKAIRPSTSGTRATFRQFVLGGKDEVANPNDNVLKKDSTSTVLSYVEGTPGAIGYVGLPALVNEGNKVVALTIDGVTPTDATIRANSYPFWNYEHLYTRGEESPLVSAFISFMLSDTVQRIATNQQYIPINALISAARALMGNDTHMADVRRTTGEG
jgi:phosphate transport system substrate-binding protein